MTTTGAHRLFLSARDLSSGCKIARLPHPRTAQPIAIALADNEFLLEINKFREPQADNPCSWLLTGTAPERVQQDGSLFVATPLDPLFLLLPPLRQLTQPAQSNRRESSAGLYRPMSELSSEAGSEEATAALEATALALPDLLQRLRAICDVNDKYDEPMVRLNEVKLSAWLQRKVEALRTHLASDSNAAKLAARRVADAHTSQFDELGAAPSAAPPADNLLLIAVALVSEYLDAHTQSTLCTACGVAEPTLLEQRGPEKKVSVAAAAPPPLYPGAQGSGSSAGAASSGSSWENDLADADAQIECPPPPPPPLGGANKRVSDDPAPAAKKLKPAAPAKSKAASVPLKKGQKTMMGFFQKPK